MSNKPYLSFEKIGRKPLNDDKIKQTITTTFISKIVLLQLILLNLSKMMCYQNRTKNRGIRFTRFITV